MSTRTLIENWLSQSSLAAGGLCTLDADGFLAVPYGSITLTLAVPEGEAFLVLYAPLMSVSGGSEQVLARFFWQLEGDLPAGMAFGMDYDGILVSMVGQYRTQGLDAAGFDALLREAAAGADEQRPRLEALLVELMAEEKSSGSESRTQTGTAQENSSLSDHELLHARLMQGIRY